MTKKCFVPSRASLAIGACAALVGMATLVQHGQPLQAQGLNFDNIEVETMHVQGNVYMAIGGPFNAAFSVGDDGVLVVDTMVEPLADKLIAAIREVAGDKAIHYIVNTHAHGDHTGGNIRVAEAGASVVGGNFTRQVGQAQEEKSFIWAHEGTLNLMMQPQGNNPAPPVAAWPTDTYFTESKEVFFNGEAVQLFWEPAAHTGGDSIVFFRKSDVIVAGDIYTTAFLPIFNIAQGGSINGVLAAVNHIIDLAVPADKQEGGTYIIPGHGRLTDEADIVEFRDMSTILRDRFADAIDKGMTLEQVKAANLVLDYEGRYGSSTGFWTTDTFIEAMYQSLSGPAATTSQNR